MKRRVFWTALAVSFMLAAAAFVTGCADDGDGGGTYAENYGGGNRGVSGANGAIPVTINALSPDGLVKFSSGESTKGRAILPSASKSEDFTFFLCYDDPKSTPTPGTPTVKEIALNMNPNKKEMGTYSTQLTADVYKMTLYAVPNADVAPPVGSGTISATASDEAAIKAKAAFRSYAVVDLTHQSTVSFLLTTNGLDGNGDYDIEFEAADDFNVPTDNSCEITAGLYYSEGPQTDVLVTGTQVKLEGVAGTDSDGNAKGVFKTADDANKLPRISGGIKSGIYNLKVLCKVGSTVKTLHNESVTIQVNQTSVATRASIQADPEARGPVIVSDLGGKTGDAPKAPQQFIAGYAPPVGTWTGVYTVEFAWVDTSDYEDGFEIDLMRVDDDPKDAKKSTTFPAMPTNDDDWGTLKGQYTTSTNVFDSTTYIDDVTVVAGVDAWRNKGYTAVDILTLNSKNLPSFIASMSEAGDLTHTEGSLAANAKHLKIQLPLAHRYVARIRAVSEAGGASPYTYLKLPIGGTRSDGTPDPLDTSAITVTDVLNLYKPDGTSNGTFKCDPTAAGDSGSAGITADTPFDEGVQTLNLYRINYNTAGGIFRSLSKSGSAAGTGTVENDVKLLTFHSQHNGSGGLNASSTHVGILNPDTKIEDKSVDPNVAEFVGEDNTPEMSGLANNKRLELKSLMNGYWDYWAFDSADSGKKYEQDNGTTKNKLYTGYDNLDLFAHYDGGAADGMLSGNIVIDFASLYALKPSYITMNLYCTTTAQDGSTTESTSDYEKAYPGKDDNGQPITRKFKSGAKLSEFPLGGAIPLARGNGTGKADTIEFVVEVPPESASSGTGSGGATGGGAAGSGSTPTTPGTTPTTPGAGGGTTSSSEPKFIYDKIRVEVYSSITGSLVSIQESSDIGSKKTVKLPLPTRKGFYTFRIWGYKGSHKLDLSNSLILSLTT